MEINFVRSEIVQALDNIHHWSKPQRVLTYDFQYSYAVAIVHILHWHNITAITIKCNSTDLLRSDLFSSFEVILTAF